MASVPLGAVHTSQGDVHRTRDCRTAFAVVISEDHSAPVFSIAVNYNVGSRDERKGRTGFAHLFEHMMFKGSENVGTGEHFVLVFNNGGDMNGTTNQDRTVYYERLPANQLDLGAVSRIRPHAVAGGDAGKPRQPAPGRAGRTAPARGQSAVRSDLRNDPRAGVRELCLRALADRLDGRSQRCDAGRCDGVLQDLLRAEQRGA